MLHKGVLRIAAVFCIGFASIHAACGQNDSVFTLRKYLSLAIEKNLGLVRTGQNLQTTKANVTYGNAGLAPTVNAFGGIGTSINTIRQVFANPSLEPINRSGAINDNHNIGIALNWVLYAGGESRLNLERLRLLETQSQAQLNLAIQNTLADATQAYLRYQLIKQQLAFLNRTLALSRERVTLAKNRYEGGMGSKQEYLNAQVDQNADASALIQTQIQFASTKHLLNQLAALEASSPISFNDSMGISKAPLRYEEIKPVINEQNQQVLAARLAEEIAEKEVSMSKANQMPSLSFNASGQYTGQNFQAGFLKTSNTLTGTVGLTGTWLLYDGGNVKRLQQLASIARQARNTELADLKLRLSNNFEDVWVSYSQGLSLLTLEQQNQKIALQNEQIAFERYKIGVATPLEFREAQRNSLAAVNRLAAAKFQVLTNEIELLRLSNRLLPIR